MVTNPWLDLPLTDYEGHMEHPSVAQAAMLRAVLEALIVFNAPRSVAVLGCAGGNGLEQIPPERIGRVVAVDINPDYVDATRARFGGRFAQLETKVCDIAREDLDFAPVDLVFAGLILEYADPDEVLPRIRRVLNPGGVLATVVQLPSPHAPPVAATPFARTQALAGIMRTVVPAELRRAASDCGLKETSFHVLRAALGKQFQLQQFRLENPAPASPAGIGNA